MPTSLTDSQARAHALLGLALAGVDTDLDNLEPKAGDVIGPYTLVSKLGEGGFGVVWRAQQTEPLNREVALKIIRPGMDSREVLARFCVERQSLARMSHASIATVLDAGATPQKRPYFVMELIDGLSLTAYAKARGLGLRERLQLFIKVCHAVQHAHQRGVVHRDLKPSNILVKDTEDQALPKVIDFGIAKALTNDANGFMSLSLSAAGGLIMGTPQYMAPEHSLMGSDEVDVRSDVFSLGAILYELLTGETPLGEEPEKRVSLSALLKRICEEEPLRPSTCVLRARAEGRLVHIPATALSNDLDWVILKALEKLPDDRYPSVTALADDLQNYLNDLPVSVGPPTAWYQLRKFARRHQTAVTLGTLVAALTMGAVITIILSYLDESRARKVADEMRQRSEISEQMAQAEVRKSGLLIAFLTELLDRAAEHVERGQNAEVLRLALSEIAPQINHFADQPELQAQLYQQLGDIYSAMDEPKSALPFFQKQWQNLVALYGAQDIRPLKVLYEVARTQTRATLRVEAIETYRLVSSGYAALGKTQSKEWFDSRRRMAAELIALNRRPEAAAVLQDLSSRRDQSGAMGHENNEFLRAMAELHWLMGEFQEAEALLEQSLSQLGVRRLDEPHLQRSRAATLRAYSKLEVQRGNLAQAAQRLEQGILAEIAASGPANHQLINRWIEVARLYARVGRFQDAERATQSARNLAKERGHLGQQVHALQASAEIQEQAGNLALALLYRQECEPLAAQIVDDKGVRMEQWRAIITLNVRLAEPKKAENAAINLWGLIRLRNWREPTEDTDFRRTLFDTMIQACQDSKTLDPDLLALWKNKRNDLSAVKVP